VACRRLRPFHDGVLTIERLFVRHGALSGIEFLHRRSAGHCAPRIYDSARVRYRPDSAKRSAGPVTSGRIWTLPIAIGFSELRFNVTTADLRLRQERDIPAKAAGWFAQESKERPPVYERDTDLVRTHEPVNPFDGVVPALRLSGRQRARPNVSASGFMPAEPTSFGSGARRRRSDASYPHDSRRSAPITTRRRQAIVPPAISSAATSCRTAERVLVADVNLARDCAYGS